MLLSEYRCKEIEPIIASMPWKTTIRIMNLYIVDNRQLHIKDKNTQSPRYIEGHAVDKGYSSLNTTGALGIHDVILGIVFDFVTACEIKFFGQKADK